jgi:predicted choloylglycine hydrolase
MHQIQLAGTHEELGRAYGEYVAERELNSWWRKPNERELAFTKACEQAIAEHAPGYLDELRALAEVTKTDYDIALFNMVVIYLAENTACNVVAVSGKQTASGRTIFVRNHDWEDEDIEYVTCFRTGLKDGLRHIAFGFADPGRYDGMNEVAGPSSSIRMTYRLSTVSSRRCCRGGRVRWSTASSPRAETPCGCGMSPERNGTRKSRGRRA